MSMLKNFYKNILVAVDLSKNSEMLMKKAEALAKLHKIDLDVIHVISMAIPYYSYSFSTEIQDAIYSNAKHQFIHFCEKHNISKERRHLLIGSPKLQILDLLNKMKNDLLIVGSHGDHHILPVAFGSTANSLVGKANCDVLTVSVHQNVRAEHDIGNQETTSKDNIVV